MAIMWVVVLLVLLSKSITDVWEDIETDGNYIPPSRRHLLSPYRNVSSLTLPVAAT